MRKRVSKANIFDNARQYLNRVHIRRGHKIYVIGGISVPVDANGWYPSWNRVCRRNINIVERMVCRGSQSSLITPNCDAELNCADENILLRALV